MRPLLCLFVCLALAPVAVATHLVGGYVRVESASSSSNTVRVVVTIYTNTAEPPSLAGLEVFGCLGDGTTLKLQRTLPVQAAGNILVSEYQTLYTYAGPGVYRISATIVNRTSSVRNINNGLAVEQPLALQATVQIGPLNRMPVLKLPTTGVQVSLNQRLTLLLGGTDADGDSLSYRLTYPSTSQDPYTASTYCTSLSIISGYQFPNEVRHVGAFRLNARTGELTWDTPTEQGLFCVVMLVSEWRNGALISQTQQELLLFVLDKGGPPVTSPAYEPVDLGVITATSPLDRDALQLTVSPNPVSAGLIQVELKTAQSMPVTLQLLDGQGRLYETITLPPASTTHRHTFDLAQQPAGLYLIRAEGNGHQVVRKVLRQ